MAFVVIASVLIMVILSLLKVNVLLAIVISALSAGLMSGLSLADTVALFVENMGGSANTALSYVLLGGFAVAISLTGITTGLVQFLRKAVKGKRGFMLIAIALSHPCLRTQCPVHIAFVPILIPAINCFVRQNAVGSSCRSDFFGLRVKSSIRHATDWLRIDIPRNHPR